ncbi:MAG: serine/threonine-protein kinase, partial [Dokdonella sp.]|uniref:serine/threonine-protein kinase n=1 Tax=Dokdonella sp. TaxID=2291710 RepID=UPI003264CFF6
MDAQRWRRTRTLFDAMVDRAPADWAEYLARDCADDADVHTDVLAMLRADAATKGLPGFELDADIAQVAGQWTNAVEMAPSPEPSDGLIGPFRLVREIGRGGMGSVWLAERADGTFEQRVAIKLVRGGWDADDLLARFRAERQILAGLQHPNIAHLVDGGVTSDGKPWLALEYIDGEDVRAACDRQQLGIDARLRVFLTVCAAVGHAHQRLVVHRDLKPSNILIGRDGEVKLLDFG